MGRKTVASTVINYPLIWGQGELEVRLPGGPYLFRFQRKWVKDGDHGLGGFMQADGLEMLFDRDARIAYTAVEVTFPEEVKNTGLPDDGMYVREMLRIVINRVLEVYRVDTYGSYPSECYVEPLSQVDLKRVQIRVLQEDGKPENNVSWAEQFGGGLQKARVAAPSADAVQALETGERVPLPFILLSDAKRNLIYTNPRVAVIESNSAFEIAVQSAVAAYWNREGKGSADVSSKLDCGLKNLIKDHLPKACQQSFAGTTEHTDWERDAYDIRNQVVHAGAPVDEQMAAKAVRACERAVVWIGNHAQWMGPPEEAE